MVGQAFITAVESYAEASGLGGGPAALAQGLSPLDGILVPTLGAYDLAVTFLFPFVAIRLISSELESGAAKLLAQSPLGIGARLSAKVGVLLAGWLVAWIPAGLALVLWSVYGGHLEAGETANLFLGHLLHVVLATGIAFTAASLCRGGSSAAIATLGFTVGTWALAFVAEGREGWLARVAPFTPASALRTFEQGELRWATLAILVFGSLAGIGLAAVWLDPFRPLRLRLVASLGLLAVLSLGLVWAGRSPRGWDLAEDRRNSFPRSDEEALGQFDRPFRITVYLAPEDPKRVDLERNVLTKLRRVVPRLDIVYAAGSRTGLFEDPSSHYGEVWYQVGSRREQLRSTIEPVVLAKLYELAGVAAPAGDPDPPYPGYPLAAPPRGAAFLFYAAWPLAVVVGFLLHRRPWRPV